MSPSNETGLFSDFPEFDSLLSSLSHLLFDINGDILTLQQFLETLESRTANYNGAEKITKKAISNIEKTTEKMTDMKSVIEHIVKIDNHDLNHQRVLSKDKILRDVNFSVNEFKNCQYRLKKFNEQLNAENKTALMHEEEDTFIVASNSLPQGVRGNKMQMIVERHDPSQLEIEYQNKIIEERNQEIGKIQTGIQDINSIFKDLSSLVVEQGQMLNTIESNIYSAESNMKLGANELTKALEYQKRKSKLCFYLFFVLFMILLFTIILTF
ncbi:hypothetical protein QEN19_002213 [Hanseniaspora menglaensis]